MLSEVLCFECVRALWLPACHSVGFHRPTPPAAATSTPLLMSVISVLRAYSANTKAVLEDRAQLGLEELSLLSPGGFVLPAHPAWLRALPEGPLGGAADKPPCLFREPGVGWLRSSPLSALQLCWQCTLLPFPRLPLFSIALFQLPQALQCCLLAASAAHRSEQRPVALQAVLSWELFAVLWLRSLQHHPLPLFHGLRPPRSPRCALGASGDSKRSLLFLESVIGFGTAAPSPAWLRCV